ncbi:conserved hypothetical protein [Theileria orientalis strain Shintoku]|uniref:Uncharacterized protein n=1 Tax=Theileria orientalis strain Shintoku TaxID=869250 RepID=J4C4G1_THEOR|nr:conserved hypothetical protein [Theileria orientalis strain Shintoku]BAM42126.1 conserved hypothetical protein [Theileria orientalis strain Shintoku]|eukprot:XP_009692427.1 conserved hypothetical protein [Theileria orientalis strain Shintoku]
MGSDFKNELDNLKEKGPDIAKVLKNSTETFEKYFQDGFTEEFSWFNLNTFPDLRLDNLDSLLDKLRSALKLTSPCVEEANEMVSKLNHLNEKVESIRDKMRSISVTRDFSNLCALEKRINENYSKLKCVEKLKTHLNPRALDHYRADLRDEEYEEFIKIVQSAESLKRSREFCYSLKKLEDLSESPSLLEALKKIDDNFEKISEMCYLWLIQRTKRISVLSSTLTSDSGIINEPLINVSEEEDRIGIASLFEINISTPRRSHGKPGEADFGTKYGPDQYYNDNETGENGAKLSLRMLKLLILDPKCLERFLNDINEFLSELSYRRFSLLLQYIKLDMKYKNNAIYDLFMNLQLVLTLIKSCVISLYYNCELNLYANPYLDVEIMSAPKYIDKIAEKLVAPLENKLEQILNASGMEADTHEGAHAEADFFAMDSQTSLGSSTDEGTLASTDIYQDIQVADILDLYAAVQICNFYYNKMLNILRPPYLCPQAGAREGDCEEEEGVGEVYYAPEDSPILRAFAAMCARWNDLIINKLQQNITVPLSDERTSRRLNADVVVATVANFLSEIVSIQLEYSASDDLLTILQMTLNPVINWCQKVSKTLGARAHFFLIASFSTLLNAIQSPFVNSSFKLLLEDLVDNNVEVVSHVVLDAALAKLGGRLVEVSPVNVQFAGPEFLERMRQVVYTNTLLDYVPPDIAEGFADLDTTSTRLLYRRVYGFMARLYREHSGDPKVANDLVELASSYE